MPGLWPFGINFEYHDCEIILGFNIRKSRSSNNFLSYYSFGDLGFFILLQDFRASSSISEKTQSSILMVIALNQRINLSNQ